jgi:hypothetical protein
MDTSVLNTQRSAPVATRDNYFVIRNKRTNKEVFRSEVPHFNAEAARAAGNAWIIKYRRRTHLFHVVVEHPQF